MSFNVIRLRKYEHGFNLALENALHYHADAEYLKRDGRLLSATLIGIYALDELGKACLIARAALWPDATQRTFLDTNFKNHGAKLAAIQRLANMFEGGFLLDDAVLTSIVDQRTGVTLGLRTNAAFVSRQGGDFVAPDASLHPSCESLLQKVERAVSVLTDNRERIRGMFNDKAAEITAARGAK